MWQHAANIVIGLLLIAFSFIFAVLSLIALSLLWLYAGAGIVVSALGAWGFMDEIMYESHSGKKSSMQ